ncbi:MAG: toll/interleukin-1 receptor domain-containing protein [candidate division WOR-3 bacterium]|nr:MAG: toll/interleukin-1 receptor domain-containing protein [candidate division WOR-3 bacterium]
MAYKVFISHSARDQGLVMALSRQFVQFGVDVLVAEWYVQAGQPLSAKVRSQMEDSDCVVVLLTRDGQRSHWVQQEIGIAVRAGKLVIPLVEQGTPQEELGILGGVEYISYDPTQPLAALDRASGFVKSLKARKDEKQRALLVTGGIVAFLLLLSAGSE